MSATAETPLRRLWSEFTASRLACAGLAVTALIVLVAVLAPWISPQNPYDLQQLSVLDARLPPGTRTAEGVRYWLGTDDQGRDMLSAIFYGLRISMMVGLLCTAIAAVVGTALGLAAAWFGGAIDAFIMRLADTQLAFPSILIALIFLALFGKGADKIVLALVLVQWTYYARTVRGSALVELRKEYVEAARGLQLPRARILFAHILPNCLPPLLVVATVQVAIAIGLEATLSFLGLGLPVTEPSLGLLISNGYGYMLSGNYWISFFPGVALLVAVLAINTVADQLADVLNPRLKR
ncbi:ABC transporter permease [Ramlibacter sp. G-1-2-2]|uniref:ABC transporter permease n=1 Tax=Ramlibacter agri TaxID=2728837 RepID=A0A848H9A4_9BURK|nr:ABC transporter permease [Ramlibacter agri]NML47077.1 ABC transporter permease [Ramlibacter agri]